MDFSEPTELGQTGLRVGRIGLGAGYGAPSAAFEEGFERGCNYFYWTARKSGMREAIANIRAAGKRDKMVIAAQSYSRSSAYMAVSLKRALKSLSLEYVDVFVLGWYNKAPSPKLVERALEMQKQGMFRFLAMSGHRRTLFPQMAQKGIFDLFHIRYNAAHRGAESETFPHLKTEGIVSYTATRWGHMLQPKRMPPGRTPPSSTDCYRFVLSNPKVDVCMCGPKNMDQMRQALKTLETGPMDGEEMGRMCEIGDFVHRRRSFF